MLVDSLCALETNVYIYSLQDAIIRWYLRISFVQAVSSLTVFFFLLWITSVNKREMFKFLTLWIPLIIPVGLTAQCVCVHLRSRLDSFIMEHRHALTGNLFHITQLYSLSFGLFCAIHVSTSFTPDPPHLPKSQNAEYQVKSNLIIF